MAAGAGILAACATPTPETVEVVVTATPAPTAVPAPAEMDIWAITTVEDLDAEWAPDPENEEFKKQWWTGGLLRLQVKDWLAEHPGVTAKVTGHNWDWALRQNLYLAFAAGIYPDTSYGEAYVSEFVALDLYSPLSESVAAMFPEGTWRAAQGKDGRAYGFAETTGANVLFINLDVVDQAGLSSDPADMPATWDELIPFAQTISENNDGNCYFTYLPAANNFGIGLRMGHWWEQNNTPLGSPQGEPSLNVPGAADVWLFHNDLMYTTTMDVLENINAFGEGAGASPVSFDAGDIAIKMGWNNDATYILAPRALAIEIPIPAGGKKATTLVGNQINSAVKNGPNPELAISYIEHSTTNVEAQRLKPNGCGIWLPALTSELSQYETYEYLGGYPDTAKDNVRVTMKAVLDGGAGPRPGWPKSGDRIWNAWNESYGRIWRGDLDKDAIQAELDALQATVTSLVNA
jgi:ABC-type glycerol-3-phosphate transport system substrate-binding protein